MLKQYCLDSVRALSSPEIIAKELLNFESNGCDLASKINWKILEAMWFGHNTYGIWNSDQVETAFMAGLLRALLIPDHSFALVVKDAAQDSANAILARMAIGVEQFTHNNVTFTSRATIRTFENQSSITTIQAGSTAERNAMKAHQGWRFNTLVMISLKESDRDPWIGRTTRQCFDPKNLILRNKIIEVG